MLSQSFLQSASRQQEEPSLPKGRGKLAITSPWRYPARARSVFFVPLTVLGPPRASPAPIQACFLAKGGRSRVVRGTIATDRAAKFRFKTKDPHHRTNQTWTSVMGRQSKVDLIQRLRLFLSILNRTTTSTPSYFEKF